MIKVPDSASFAAMRFLAGLIGKKVGGSTGTNLWGSLILASEMMSSGKRGSIVTLICDSGERYLDTYYDDRWLSENRFEIKPYLARIDGLVKGTASLE
jgi:cysteine synthase A